MWAFKCFLSFFLPSSLASWVLEFLHPNLSLWVHHFFSLPHSSGHIAGHASFWCAASQKLVVLSMILVPGLCFHLLPRMSWALGVHVTIWHCFKPQRAIHTVPGVSRPSLSPVAESCYLVSNHQNLHEVDLASGDWESVPSKMQESWRTTSHIKDSREILTCHSGSIFFLKLVYVCISTLLYNYRYLEMCMLTGELILGITIGFVLGMLMMHWVIWGGWVLILRNIYWNSCDEISSLVVALK